MNGEAVALQDKQGHEYIVQIDRKALMDRKAL